MSNEKHFAGSGISTAKIKKTNSVNDHLVRYVFSPMVGIALDDRNITGAMSKLFIMQGRIANLVDCPYKIRDESSDALLSQISEEEFNNSPLTEHIHTARHQAEYLGSTYGIKGLAVLEELTGVNEADVVEIEEAILPDYFDSVLELSKYLANPEAVKENIKKSGLAGENLKKAKKVVGTIASATTVALKFASDWLIESKAEIINARNGKAGKTSHDPFDMEMYRQTGLPPLQERDVNYADAQNKAVNNGNLELAEAIKLLSESTKSGDVNKEADAKINLLETQLEAMKTSLDLLITQQSVK